MRQYRVIFIRLAHIENSYAPDAEWFKLLQVSFGVQF